MEKKFDLSNKLDFSDIDLTSPEDVVKDIIAQISEDTKGIIEGIIAPYDGHIFSYTLDSNLKNITLALGTTTKEVDIQDTLGKQKVTTYKFEFYLSTPLYPQYKYRICYLKHGIGNYPVTIVMEQSIADDVFSESLADYVVKCDTREDFEKIMISIVCSKSVISVMQELIRIHQIQKQYSSHKDIAIPESNEEDSGK